MKTDILMSGSTVKNHISSKTGFECNVIRRTSFRSWFQACHRVLRPVLILRHQWHLQDRSVIILHLPQARLLHRVQTASSDSETREKGDLSGIDSHPEPVSSANVEETIERRDPLFAANLGSAAKPTQNQKPKQEETSIERRDPLFAANLGSAAKPTQNQKPNKEETAIERGDPLFCC